MQCPACASQELSAKSAFSWQQNGGKYLPAEYKLLECNDCGLWFKDFLPSENALKQYYESNIVDDSNWNYHERLPHELSIDKHLLSLKRNSSVLDVGCWTGRLLASHKDHLGVFGIEPNNESADIAGKKGITILGTHVEKHVLQNLQFDCITLIDVFEHLREPLKTINTLLEHLSPHGKIIIVTGRTDCLPVKLAGATYWYFSQCPDHLVFLNSKFIHWFEKTYPTYKISYKAVRHKKFSLKRYSFEAIWLFSWRFLNPNSPFNKPKLHRLPIVSKLQNVKDILMCFNWKDHYWIEIHKR